MPRPKIDPSVGELAIAVYQNQRTRSNSDVPTARDVHAHLADALGEGCPSERWVSNKIAEYAMLRTKVFNEPTIEPLGQDWPRNPVDVAYLADLTYFGSASIRPVDMPRLTKSEVAVALELKDLLEWDLPWDRGRGESDRLESRRLWHLPSTNGLRPELGELAIVREVAARRATESILGVDLGYSDVYALLTFKPWRTWGQGKWNSQQTKKELEMAYQVEGQCDVGHLVKALYVPPIMRVEISGPESVKTMLNVLEEVRNVVACMRPLVHRLESHHIKYYSPDTFGEFEAAGLTISELTSMEIDDLEHLASLFRHAAKVTGALIDRMDEQSPLSNQGHVNLPGFNVTSVHYLRLFMERIENEWDQIRNICWSHIDGPLIGGFTEEPDFQSWSAPASYFNGLISGFDESKLPFFGSG